MEGMGNMGGTEIHASTGNQIAIGFGLPLAQLLCGCFFIPSAPLGLNVGTA